MLNHLANDILPSRLQLGHRHLNKRHDLNSIRSGKMCQILLETILAENFVSQIMDMCHIKRLQGINRNLKLMSYITRNSPYLLAGKM